MNSTRVFQRHKIYMIIDACFFLNFFILLICRWLVVHTKSTIK